MAAAIVAVAALVAGACGRDSAGRLANRALDDYRAKSARRPLPAAGSIRVRLSPAGPDGGAAGEAVPGHVEIEWEGARYRETVTSAGISTVRGIQGGKAFFIDEDGVTRVGSEPMLAELRTRSYFWRRAWLFDDRERAKLSLGPADASSLAISLKPRGGNELLLAFDRDGKTLRRAVSPRFHLEFEDATRFRDLSRAAAFAAGEIVWTGLPTRRLPDPTVGGWHGRFADPFAEAALDPAPSRLVVPATISGAPARLALDAGASGPLRVAPELARRAGLSGRKDVFGRLLADGATLAIGTLAMPDLHVEIGEAPEGADAVAGGVLTRETILEIDPGAGRVRIHDPARWVPPEGFGRNVVDDDGNVPAAILFRAGRRLRLRPGVTSSSPLVLAARTAAELGLAPAASELTGLVWGTLRLPPIPTRIAGTGFEADWGDDGAIGAPLLRRFHVYLDLPHRWIYVRPAEDEGQRAQSAR